MAALCEGVTSLGQLILQFLTCVIFRTEKDRVFERQRQISVADEETVLDICGNKERDEQSTTRGTTDDGCFGQKAKSQKVEEK